MLLVLGNRLGDRVGPNMRCSRVYSCGRKGRARMGRVMIPGAGGLCTASCLGYCPAADLCLTGFKTRDDCQTARAGWLQCASWACGIWIAGFWPAATAFTHSSPRSATHIPCLGQGDPRKGHALLLLAPRHRVALFAGDPEQHQSFLGTDGSLGGIHTGQTTAAGADKPPA